MWLIKASVYSMLNNPIGAAGGCIIAYAVLKKAGLSSILWVTLPTVFVSGLLGSSVEYQIKNKEFLQSLNQNKPNK